ncbi:MAG: hypothetical protein WB870_11665 [Gallionellaceae bacterium]
MIQRPTKGFAIPPYRACRHGDFGWVGNSNGFNCLSFPERPGVIFTTPEKAIEIAEMWNKNIM